MRWSLKSPLAKGFLLTEDRARQISSISWIRLGEQKRTKLKLWKFCEPIEMLVLQERLLKNWSKLTKRAYKKAIPLLWGNKSQRPHQLPTEMTASIPNLAKSVNSMTINIRQKIPPKLLVQLPKLGDSLVREKLLKFQAKFRMLLKVVQIRTRKEFFNTLGRPLILL